MYSIVRADLELSKGEAAAQAIHAALGSFQRAPSEIKECQVANGHGNVIVLKARNEGVLQAAYARATELNLPCCLFVDGDRPQDGPTALGLGPLMNGDGKEITKRFQLL